MKVAVIHPLRHHVYHSMEGVVQSGVDVVGLFGYFNRGDCIDKFLMRTKFRHLVEGWSYEPIAKYVKTSLWVKILFLLYKKFPNKFENIYFKYFQKWCIKQLKDVDCIHVLQDYCNDVIRYAYSRGIKIVYEQIIPFYYGCLLEEIENVGFDKSYINSRYSKDKLELQIENIKIASVIIGASFATEKTLKQISDRNIYIFPYGAQITCCNDEILAQNLWRKQNKEKLKILYIGAINLLKGVRYIIEAAELLVEKPFEFTFVGKPTSIEDTQMIEKIKSLPNCEYIESIPHSKINKIYQDNDIFVFQGICEGFGMVTLEAMANGLPCLVSIGGCGIVKNNVDGFINENRDVVKIVENLELLFSNRELLKELSINARNDALLCTWDDFSKNIADVYNKEII